ncbi:hypothetical protein B0H14DRAFT_2558938 [Mycena olivaceomarginata]|nr:hypothetical protein B0H14DRAFT_2558938 [Mycena olivaceomarginata]
MTPRTVRSLSASVVGSSACELLGQKSFRLSYLMYASFVGVSEVESRARGLATYPLRSGEVHLEPFGSYMPSDRAQTSSVHQQFKSIQRFWLSPLLENNGISTKKLWAVPYRRWLLSQIFPLSWYPCTRTWMWRRFDGCSERVGACAAVLKLNLDGNAAIDLFFQG